MSGLSIQAAMATAPGGRGAVAAGHDATAAAAVEILADGGNAFDAVVAALAASFVVEPALSSPGGGGFLMAHPVGAEPRVLDFFTQTPGRAAPERGAGLDFLPLNADFGPATQEFHVGCAAAAVPGMVPGLCAIQRELARLPLARLLAPAVAMARAGVPMAPLQAHIIEVIAPILTLTEAARAVFAAETGDAGRTIAAGCARPMRALADTLEALGREGERLFRDGPVAQAMVAMCQDGGLLAADDLARYAVEWRRPLERRFAGARVLTNPPPSAGGALIAFGLALAEGGMVGPGDLATIMHLTTEARDATGLNLGIDEARVSALLDETALARWRALKRGGTTHVSVLDGEGNAAAATVSNGEGCGHMVPGTGFMLNNMLGEQDLNPAGFFRWAPDTRVASMMAPTLAERPDGRVLALGSGGSNRIRTALLQVLCAVLARGESLDRAVAAPRLHVERGHLDIEAGWPEEVVAALTTAWPDHRVWPDRSMFYGGVHAVERAADGTLIAVGDPRRGGAAAIAV
jgi:gamma-glutamyltranspeptidase/glutathione hydrolase